MKSRRLTILILLAIPVILMIAIWPMAPLWQRLGLKLKCIEGTFPDLQIVPCPDQAAAPVTPLPLPTPSPDGPVPMIFDDDGSPDGMVALLYFLRSPLFDVRAVTVSYGEAHPEQFAPHIAQVLAALGRAEVPVGYGSPAPLAGSNAFPDSWREASDAFWGLQIPKGANATTPVPAAALIAETVAASERPVTIFISGSHTNLAEALRLNPDIKANIQDVFIMGGAVEVQGNIHHDWPAIENEAAEWNIWVDPVAADEVFSSGLALHLVPLDATRQVTWTRKDLPGWRSSGAPESDLAADLVQMMLDAFSVDSVFVWDLVAAVQASQPAVCREETSSLEVITGSGLQQGRTQAADNPPNILVCLNPNPQQIKALVTSTFQQP